MFYNMTHIIVLDSINVDIFVCGVCKCVFNSLKKFMEHKSYEHKSFEHKNKEYNYNNIDLEENVIDPTVVKSPVVDLFPEIASTVEYGVKQSVTVTNLEKQPWSKDFNCLSCKKRFKEMKSLHSHMKIHNEKPYQCLICGRCFIQNSYLQKHINSHKKLPCGLKEIKTTAQSCEADLLSYTCRYCDVILPDYTQYRVHLKNHWTLKKFKCMQGDCMDFHDTVESLLQHVNNCHKFLVFKCHICSTTFNNLDDLATHQLVHDESVKLKSKQSKHLKCPLCDAEFDKSEKLAIHMITEDHKKICVHCSKIFASDKRLRLHLQIHKKLKPFQCNICCSSFHMKKYLSSHMLIHGNRTYKCAVCKYMFKRSDLLRRHMRSHQAKKLFKCPFKDDLGCKKEFSRSDKLKSHIKIHTKNVLLNTSTSPQCNPS